jgi:hypothetical protein
VINGPFVDLRPVIYNHTRIEHCLSRGFRDGNTTGRLSGEKFSPENIGQILRQGNYTDFLRRVERDLHNTLHTSINGDFKAMTAANGEYFAVICFCVFPGWEVLILHRPPLLFASRKLGSVVVEMAARKSQNAVIRIRWPTHVQLDGSCRPQRHANVRWIYQRCLSWKGLEHRRRSALLHILKSHQRRIQR